MRCILVYVATGEPRYGAEEDLDPSEATARNDALERSGNVYRWVRPIQPHRDMDRPYVAPYRIQSHTARIINDDSLNDDIALDEPRKLATGFLDSTPTTPLGASQLDFVKKCANE